jgi:putative chitinase
MTDFEKILLAVAPNSKAAIRSGFAASMADCITRADLSSKLRLAHFIAQCAHESAGLTTTTEFASGKAYEGRKDLGNTQPGDGPRFRGHGLIQTTGRANHALESSALGVDFIAHPERLAEFPYAATSAADYWKRRGLNTYADKDSIEAVTLRVNGGENGLASRKAYLDRAKHALSDLKGALIAGAAAETQKSVTKAKIGVAPSAVVAGAGVSLHPAAQSPVPSIVIVALVAAALGCAVALVIAINRHKQTAATLTAAANGV